MMPGIACTTVPVINAAKVYDLPLMPRMIAFAMPKTTRPQRVEADVTVIPRSMADGPGGAAAAIRAASADTGLVLLGLRPPLEGESDDAYGGYLLACRRSAAGLPRTLYALAAEGIDFRDVFT